MVKLQTLDLEGNQIGEQLGLEQVDMQYVQYISIHVMYATLIWKEQSVLVESRPVN